VHKDSFEIISFRLLIMVFTEPDRRYCHSWPWIPASMPE